MLTKHVGPLAAQLFQCRPYNDREFVTNVTRIGHISQKRPYKSSCFTIYVLLDADMLQMLKNDYLDKIKNCITFVVGNIFK